MSEQDNFYLTEDGDLNQKSNKEKLAEYQRKFRNLESDRKTYAEETVAIIKKQSTIVDKLKTENAALKDLIAKLNNQQKSASSNIFQKSQTSYGDNLVDNLKIQIDEEKRNQGEIDQNISDFLKKIKEKKMNLGGVNAGLENQTALSKQIKILENRLDKANQKFNEAIATNKNLRQNIDSLRRERVIFDNLYKKLEKELHEKRKEMANIIETANTAYEERDKANDQIQNLKQQAKRESADFEKDLRDLSILMEKNKKTLDYMKLTEKNKEEIQHVEVPDMEKLSKSKSMKVQKDKNNSVVNIEKIQKFEEDFAKIQAATQIKNFEDLIKIFVQNEELNFNMFKYVNELSNDIEDLEKQLMEYRKEKEMFDGQDNPVDIQRKHMLKRLEEKLQRNEEQSGELENKYNDSLNLIRSLTNWIETLFNTIECDKAVAKELAGSQGVTDTNMMTFLGLIEDRTNYVLQAYSQIISQKNNENLQSLLSISQGISNVATQNKGKFDVPAFADEIEEDDIEGNKPFTVEEFRAKAIEKLEINNKKQQTVKKIGNKTQVATKKKAK